MVILALVASMLVGVTGPASAVGPNAIVTDAGCSTNQPAAAPDGSIALPFPINFGGTTYSSFYLIDGYVAFGHIPSIEFMREELPAPVIAPFYALADSGTTTYGTTTFGARTALCVTWLNMEPSGLGGGQNNFQLLLVDRSDVGPGDFDAIFNYDRVQWNDWESITCMDPLDPNIACPPFPAIVGFRSNTFEFRLPGSGSSAFLDGNTTSGLIHSSFGTLQLGRYRFEFRAGSASTGAAGNGVISGQVKDAVTGAALPGASVQLCSVIAGCLVTTANGTGSYSFVGLRADSYIVTAFPPSGTTYMPEYSSVLGLQSTESRTVNLQLRQPQPLPPGSTLTPSSLTPQGVPRIFWNSPLTLTTNGCPGGTATWEARRGDAAGPFRSGTMVEGPLGVYSATIPSMNPTSGAARIVMVVTCPDGSISAGDFDFNIYIDPSGVVRDTTGTLLVGATVVLFRSDQIGGPFTQVPDGSAIMSPSNRKNPDLTDSVGHFGWDVIAGYYTVRASKPGCHNPANPAQAYTETHVMTIPPPVFDLDIRLECPQTTSDYNPLTPARILDTRTGLGGISGKVGPGQSVDLTVIGVGGVPAAGVGAVVLNVTVTEPTAVSWLAVYPAGQPLPLASNLNFSPNQDVPNLVIAKVGASGKVSIHNNLGSTHVAADVMGWIAAGATSFTSLTPARILDTRNGTGGITGKVGPGQSVDVTVVGAGGVPATGVGAVVLNVTVTEPTAPSWLAVYPTGQPLPLASNLNFVPNQDVPNLVIAKVGAGGKVTVHNNLGSTHVVFDVAGWLPPSPAFTALAPVRILDTRNGTGGITGKVGPGQSVEVTVVGVGGVPATGVSAVVLNVTVTEPTATSWLAVYPAGQPLPLASNLNFVPNQDVPNLVIAKVGAGGKVRVHNNLGSTHVVADVMGSFAA